MKKVLILVSLICIVLFTSCTKVDEINIDESVYEKPTIESTIMHDGKYFNFTLESISENDYGNISYSYTITNKTAEKINVFCNPICINDIQVNTGFYHMDMEPNETIRETRIIFAKELKNAQVDFVTSIQMYFSVIDSMGKRVEDKILGEVKTNLFEKYQQNYEKGKTVFEDEKMKVQFLNIVDNDNPLTENKKNLTMMFYNKTDEEVNLWLGDKYLFLDDKPYSYSFNTTIQAGKYSVNSIVFGYVGEADEIEKVKMSFSYFDGKTYDVIDKTDEFEFTTK